MDDRYLIVLPRGFIGRVNAGLDKETNILSLSDKMKAIRYNNATEDSYTEVFNLNVTQMYESMINQTVTRDKLTFIKAIIIEASRNFVGHDFTDWINLQRDSRYYTRNHQEFVLDTLRFIQTGKRNTSLRTWEVLLRRKLIDDTQSVYNNRSYDQNVSSFFKSIATDGQPLTGSMHRVISQWMSHRGGYEDLLLTLNIIFGKEFNK